VETDGGILLTPGDPEVEQALTLAGKAAKRYRSALRELARWPWPVVHASRGGSRGSSSMRCMVINAANTAGCPTSATSTGSKRIGFLGMVTFLALNGFVFETTDADVVTRFVALAAGDVSEDELANWIRGHSRKARL